MIFDYCIEKAVNFFRSIEDGLTTVCVAAVVIAVVVVVFTVVKMVGEWINGG